MAISRKDPSQEMARVRQMLEYVISHLRERQPRLDDAESERLFEEARETLAGLHAEFATWGKQERKVPSRRAAGTQPPGPYPH
jgi:hypothetical protein